MKIVFVSTFFSEGMGYTENCLPQAMASLGHDVHILTSEYNVYGNLANFDYIYSSFLGSAKLKSGLYLYNGMRVHRLESMKISDYILITGLRKKIMELSPDIVHVTEIASLNTYKIGILKLFYRFKLFAESHQHLSVMKPYVVNPNLNRLKFAFYKLTRTLPTVIVSSVVEKCYAIAPDCVFVANKYYGVPLSKIKLQELGSDTLLFRPRVDFEDEMRRDAIRKELGIEHSDLLCIYTGRFTKEKDPLVLAEALNELGLQGQRVFGLFIGEGAQKSEIENCKNTRILAFMRHDKLVDYYRAADIGIWPKQESMSMLDAAATGLPIIVSNLIGDVNRVDGNGLMYSEGDPMDLANKIVLLKDSDLRHKMGAVGIKKIQEEFSWMKLAKSIEKDYGNN